MIQVSIIASNDIYGGRMCHLEDETNKNEAFEKHLHDQLRTWRDENVRGIWMRVNRCQIAGNLVAPLLNSGFEIHHAQKEYMMLTKWLPDPTDDPNAMPPYATHYVGVGGVLFNEHDELLVVAERFAYDGRPDIIRWKFPGGLANANEKLSDAAEREVWEETGIQSKFHHLVSFRHNLRYRFGTNDFYFVCQLELDDHSKTDIKHDPLEIAHSAWKPMHELLCDERIYPMNRQFMALAFEQRLLQQKQMSQSKMDNSTLSKNSSEPQHGICSSIIQPYIYEQEFCKRIYSLDVYAPAQSTEMSASENLTLPMDETPLPDWTRSELLTEYMQSHGYIPGETGLWIKPTNA